MGNSLGQDEMIKVRKGYFARTLISVPKSHEALIGLRKDLVRFLNEDPNAKNLNYIQCHKKYLIELFSDRQHMEPQDILN